LPTPPGDGIGSGVARAREITGTDKEEVFDVGRQRVRVKCGVDRVSPFAQVLQDRVPAIANDEQVVAETADHGVITSAAIDGVVARTRIQRVLAGAARHRIVQGIAGAVKLPRTRFKQF
jgi:hypothetical protein